MSASQTLEVSFESLARAMSDGLEDLLVEHYEEVAVHKDRVPFAPNWEKFRVLEGRGMWRLIGARSSGELVGYTGFYIGPSLHYGSLFQADNNIIYLMPSQRRGLAGMRLIRASEELLVSIGVNYIRYHAKMHVAADRGTVGRLLERCGYALEERVYGKLLME